MRARIILSRLTDPFINLAIENSLLDKIVLPTLFLYQNDPCVVIGRAQNPWLEADVAFLEQMNIPLLRRVSGGGTVVHDHGNLNFSFLSPKNQFDKMSHMKMVQSALSMLGIAVQITAHHDLFIGDKKVSGSAFRQTQKNCFHHGTLLIESNLDLLRRCLNVPSRKITSNAVPSRRSSVMNLKEVLPSVQIEQIKNMLIQAFRAVHGVKSEEIITITEFSAETEIQTTTALYRSNEWVYNRTLPFREQIILQGKQIEICVEAGKIIKVVPSYPELMEFVGMEYHTVIKKLYNDFT